MTKLLDVGQYITELVPNVDKMKLYKLCYFTQGWSLAWTGRPLFPEQFEAWRRGPVPVPLRASSDQAADGHTVPHIPGGDSSRLEAADRDLIDSIIAFYGKMSSQELSELSHGKAWKEARGATPATEKSRELISNTTIHKEFTERIHAGEDAPEQPDSIITPGEYSIDNMRETITEIEKTWAETLALLADR